MNARARKAPQVARRGHGPGYWMNESSGVLKSAIEAYLKGEKLNSTQIGFIRAYLRQWIGSDWWRGDTVEELRRRVEDLNDRASIRNWLNDALKADIDPL